MKVQKSLLPFSSVFTTVDVEDCKTVQDVVNKTIPFNFKDCKLLVTLNNEILHEKDWNKSVREKDIVGLNFVPAGGKGGKIAAQVVVTILAIVATAYTGYMGIAAFKAGNFLISAGWATATAAVSITAQLLNATLFALPTQKRGTRTGDKEDNVYSISGARNEIDKYGVVPINLGTNRMFPKQAALPYTETYNNDQYVRQLFTWGYGTVELSDIKLGDTDINDYKDWEINHVLDGGLNRGIPLYSNDVYQEDLSVKLTNKEGSVSRSSRSNANEIIVDIVFNALVEYDDQGNRNNVSVKIKIETKPTESNEWKQYDDVTIIGATSQPLRKSIRIKFDQPGQYDVRLTRLTKDNTDNDRLHDDCYLDSLRSVTYVKPVNFPDISGTALRMKATDQLNGAVDTLNAVVSTKVLSYDPDKKAWLWNTSSNPADIFRHVLQSPAFAKALTDDKIDLEKLEEWWIYCRDNNLTYNKIVDSETSVDEVLNDICAAGMATLSKVDNIYSVIIDNERPFIKGLITPRNSWDYEGSINYPELPHALRVEFRNAEKGYETDERIVYMDGYNENNATLYERLQFDSCTNADLAYWYGRRYFATALLQPETHSFKMDFENLTFNRGDRITLVNDVILVGVGQGRIKTLIYNESGDVEGFEIDDEVIIPNTNVFGVRIRDNSGSGFTYYLLESSIGVTKTFTFAEPLTVENAPSVGSLCAFVEDGKELDLIVTGIKPGSNHSATITAVDYAPARFNPIGTIPAFESNITSTWDRLVPKSPVLGGNIISDSTAVLKNSDGTYTSTMIIPLINKNSFPVEVTVKCRNLGATEWFSPRYVKRDAEEVILTGLQDGFTYDIVVYYSRLDGMQQTSLPLELNGVRFIGGSEPPADVSDFKVSVMNGIGLFEWAANEDFDLSHYIMKFSDGKDNVSWNTSQLVYDKLFGTTVSLPIHKGTYLIKAVDYFGNESANAVTIVSNDDGAFNNVVERLTQEPNWNGVKENIKVVNGNIRLSDGATSGYYYLTPETFDLGDVYTSLLLSEMNLGIVSRTGESRLVRSITTIRGVKFIRSTDEEEDTIYKVSLEMNISEDGVNWSGWKTFRASQHTFRYAKFRVYLETESLTATPEIANLSILIDMPDRYETGEDVQITNASKGAEVEYTTAFRNIPSVNITVQNGAVDDRIEFTDKTNSGFTIKVFNATLNTYVQRSFDYIAAGYGKVV